MKKILLGDTLKINYYSHYIEHADTEKEYLFDIKPFLKAFTNWETSIEIAKRLTKKREHLYLLPVENKKNFYLFVETKENDAIQKIKTTSESINSSKIMEELEKDSTIGFASYIFFDETRNLFAFSSRQNSPRAESFRNFINDLFGQLGLGRLDFKISQLKEDISKEDATNLQFIGKTSIAVNSSSELYQHIADYLIGNSVDKKDIETIEVHFKPSSRQNINDSVGRAIRKIKREGLESIKLKAKEHVDEKEALKDYFINDEGAIFNEIKTLDTAIIHQYMFDYINSNSLITTKIKEHEKKRNFTNDVLSELVEYYKIEKWKNR